MTGSAVDSGWFLPLPEQRGIGRNYRPSFTESARELFDRIKRDPDDAEAVERLASHYEDAGDLPSLATLMQGCGEHLAARGEHMLAADAFVRSADATLMGTGNFERAELMLTQAVSVAPAHEHAVRELHALLATTGKHEDARRWLEFVADALDGQPSRFRARICYRLGRVLEDHLGDYDAALARYAEALRQDQSYEPARTGLVRLQAPLATAAPPSASTAGTGPGAPHYSVDQLRARLRSRRRRQPSFAHGSAPDASSSPGPQSSPLLSPESSPQLSRAGRRVVDSLLTLPAAAVVPDAQLQAITTEDAFELDIGPTTDNNFYVGFSTDARRAGVFIATYQHLPSDRELLLRVLLPGDEAFLATARLRFVHDGQSDDMAPGVGLQLTKMSEQGRDRITRFMQQREPMFYSD